MLLVQAGARVIKVEEPGVGDYYRALAGGREFVELGHFSRLHRGKEFITLNLKSDQGRELFKELVRRADVVIENFRPGTLKRLKIQYPVLSRWNKKVILCSLTGYRPKGPEARLGGHDLNYLALSGLLSMNRDRTGQPVIPQFQLVDLSAGYRAFGLILAALMNRERTGRGSWVSVSLQETALEIASLYAPVRGPAPAVSLQGLPHYAVYQTRGGGWISFAPLEPKFVKNFCEAVGGPTGRRPVGRLKKNGLRRLFLGKTRREWGRLSQRHDFCLTPVREIGEVFGRIKKRALPPMGRDNVKILRPIGYSAGEVRDLKRRWVL